MTDTKSPHTNVNDYISSTALQKVLLCLQSPNSKPNMIEYLTKCTWQHVTFFSRSTSHLALIFRWEIYASYRALDFNILISLVSVLDFTLHVRYPTSEHFVPLGRVMSGCPVYGERIARAKHGSDTGTYGHNGKFDEVAFGRIWEFDRWVFSAKFRFHVRKLLLFSETFGLITNVLLNFVGTRKMACISPRWSICGWNALVSGSYAARLLTQVFKSCIHFSIAYPPLSEESGRELWTLFICAGSSSQKHEWLDDTFLDTGSAVQVNGRQIQNVIRVARSLAAKSRQSPCPENVLAALETMESFESDFTHTTMERWSSREFLMKRHFAPGVLPAQDRWFPLWMMPQNNQKLSREQRRYRMLEWKGVPVVNGCFTTPLMGCLTAWLRFA